MEGTYIVIYRISIQTTPESIQGSPMYFWCVFGQHGDHEVNCGHGWADSILQAAKDAQHHYQLNLFLEDSIL